MKKTPIFDLLFCLGYCVFKDGSKALEVNMCTFKALLAYNGMKYL